MWVPQWTFTVALYWYSWFFRAFLAAKILRIDIDMVKPLKSRGFHHFLAFEPWRRRRISFGETAQAGVRAGAIGVGAKNGV